MGMTTTCGIILIRGGPVFEGCHNLACSWRRNFLCNWFVALHCTFFTLLNIRGDVYLRVRVTHEFREHLSPTNNDDSTVVALLLTKSEKDTC